MKIEFADRFREYTDEKTFERIYDCDTVSKMWDRCLADYPDAVAIEDDGQKYTFSQLEHDASSVRKIVTDGGKRRGRRVGLLIPNSYDFVRAYIGVVTSQNTAVVLPVHLPAEAIAGLSKMCGFDILLYHPDLEEAAALAAKNAGILSVSTQTFEAKQQDDDATGLDNYLDARPDDACVIMFTGGTTGKSKAALLSNRAVMSGTINGCYGIKEIFSQRYILVLPLSHVFGLIRNLMTSLYTGSTLFICRNNKDMFRDIAVFKPTTMVMVPALAEMALTLSKRSGKNMLGDDLKYIICGAAPVPSYLIDEYEKLGVTLFPGYGLTESANLVSGNPRPKEKPDSVGLLYPEQEVRLVDGELWLKGANIMDGYIGVGESFTEGWFATGDLAKIDDDGFLYITGRIKEIIVLPTGENVSPAELEAKFNELSFVQDSQVFEDVTDGGRHILALEIVPRATELPALGDDPYKVMMEELQRVNKSLPSFAMMSRIEIRETDFKRTPSMKIERYKKC